ncbi:MAG: hypothetical protein COW66_13110 [Flavobacteriaceae bacterium CG18_big_fil_WC_8_21_14_2_50_34_36]|nr:MAG: hypothetical protein COW66_13110 [Flavobacteriaceae bacterium CG18_big_fil_WC_8_21_14_2_50_34_36]PJC08200.1 MAG: hypothetical protein CO068_02125 [Flavobacteriaceae bacterium CG_4_9_14_0_8_um_filter_34_30]
MNVQITKNSKNLKLVNNMTLIPKSKIRNVKGLTSTEIQRSYDYLQGAVYAEILSREAKAIIAIDNQAVLAGSIEKKYEKVVLNWVEKNKANLLIVWDNIQKGQDFNLSLLNLPK